MIPRSFTDESFRGKLAAISIAALLVRIAAILFARGAVSETVYEYDQIARNIVAGRGFSFDMYGSIPVGPTAWMAPVYPYILAAYYAVFGENLVGMAFLQALVAGITCFLIGVTGRKLSGKSVGLTAAAIFAFYPEMILLPMKFVAETWLLLWLLAMLLCGIAAVEKRSTAAVVGAGIFCGVASLTRVSALAFAPALIFWWWLKGGFHRRLLRDAVLLLVVQAAVIAPWTARNYRVFDKFIPVRTNFWVNVWRGNFPDATGTPRNFDKVLHDLALDADYRALIDPQLTGNEIHREEVYRRLALQHIRENPLRYAGLSLRRFVYFWTVDPTHPLTGHPLYWGPWALLLILAAVGMRVRVPRWRDYGFWYALFIATTVVYSLILVLPRYRIPLIPGLMLLAAEGVRFLLERRRRNVPGV